MLSGSVSALAALPIILLGGLIFQNALTNMALDRASVLVKIAQTEPNAGQLLHRLRGADLHVATMPSDQPPKANPPEMAELAQQACGKQLAYQTLEYDNRYWVWACPQGVEDSRYLLGVAVVQLRTGTMVGFTILFMGLVGIVTALVVLRILSPLSRITKGLSRVRAGERLVRVPATGLPELDVLIEQVNETARSMEEREDATLARIEVAQQMARVIAHEVRNPLHSMQLLTSLLVEQESRDERMQTADDIHREIAELNDVVTTLLQRNVREQLQLKRRKTDLRAMAERLVRVHRRAAAHRGLNIELKASNHEFGDVDGPLLARCLENLLLNAIHFAESTIRIVVEGDAEHASITVDDDGQGLPNQAGVEIYSPSYSRREGGTGTGLSLVATVLRAHGGQVSHGPSPLGGAQFRLHIPRRVDESDEDPITETGNIIRGKSP